MRISPVFIEGLKIIQPDIFTDDRGYFFESWNENDFMKNGIAEKFVQDNQSFSHKGVLRGLHFQSPPHAQGKLVRVIAGKVLDVAVDIRKNSATFGKYFSIELSAKNNTLLFIPNGFAHGFVALEEDTIFAYKCTGYYDKNSEITIRWNDPQIGIEWGIKNPSVSAKDAAGKFLREIVSPF
ncbi:MAG: dTDP-4-dehydrorhamnose 3,5-epimerase [Bacteroidetes bacterium]|nr:dTDP-4-dehydrorhamnose 3,5-epimerase [Bacteroidota bacterium]